MITDIPLKNVMANVCHITAEKETDDGRFATHSGALLISRYQILTAYHCIQDSENMIVHKPNGQTSTIDTSISPIKDEKYDFAIVALTEPIGSRDVQFVKPQDIGTDRVGYLVHCYKGANPAAVPVNKDIYYNELTQSDFIALNTDSFQIASGFSGFPIIRKSDGKVISISTDVFAKSSKELQLACILSGKTTRQPVPFAAPNPEHLANFTNNHALEIGR